jgi:hypothetical protein
MLIDNTLKSGRDLEAKILLVQQTFHKKYWKDRRWVIARPGILKKYGGIEITVRALGFEPEIS